jgi:hypothetical protein
MHESRTSQAAAFRTGRGTSHQAPEIEQTCNDSSTVPTRAAALQLRL